MSLWYIKVYSNIGGKLCRIRIGTTPPQAMHTIHIPNLLKIPPYPLPHWLPPYPLHKIVDFVETECKSEIDPTYDTDNIGNS